MRISVLLQKEYWHRRITPDGYKPRRSGLGSEYYVADVNNRTMPNVLDLTQEDFMREIEPSAHGINSKYMSTRAIYQSYPKTDEEGNPVLDEYGNQVDDWKIIGFDELETVRSGLQKRIDLSKAAYLGGGRVWVCHEDARHDLGDLLNSWKDSMGFDMAWQELVNSCCLTCDGAIYQYLEGNALNYQVFSYLKGDILFPNYDEHHRLILARLYSLRGMTAVDIYATEYVETWVQGFGDNIEKNQEWIDHFGGWFASNLKWEELIKSDDGWTRISRRENQTYLNQAVYFRTKDCPHGIAQLEIEALERSQSFIAEGVKSTSQPILLVKATNITTLPAQDSHGKTIGICGAVDELAASDAKFLGVPDLSNIATIDVANKKESILRSTLSTEITPEIFKSGADSSAAMSLLFTDEIIWAKNEFVQYYPQLKQLVEVFKALVAKVEGKPEIATMRTSCGVDFYIPRNEAERLKMELDQVYARVKSRKAAMSDIGNPHTEDYKQITDEWVDELRIKSEVPAVAKAEVEAKYDTTVEVEVQEDESNPEAPNVDNNAKGKSITE